MSNRQLTPADHLARAAHHESVGKALAEAVQHEWAVVPYFYAAYHRVKHALLTDPVFDDVQRLHAMNPTLSPEHRFATVHQVRKSPTGPRDHGVNDLVLLLYRDTAGAYDKLHQASIAVRYEHGLVIPLDSVLEAFAKVKTAHEENRLVA